MFTSIHSACSAGLEALLVNIQVDISQGFPSYTIVGLPDAAIQEARERVRAALKHLGLTFPETRITVHLAPGDQKKEGSSFDLPMALAIAMASGDVPQPKQQGQLFCVGELALDGQVLPVRGVLSATLLAKELGYRSMIVPKLNAVEAALVPGITIYAAEHLRAVFNHCRGGEPLPIQPHQPPQATTLLQQAFTGIKGQLAIKRALAVAVAGRHNVVLYGPPGSGKTILAKAMRSLLPPMTVTEMLDVTKLYSMAGLLDVRQPFVSERPFRQPHHTASVAAIVGGGSTPRPGEISLAHHGVLYFDELPEFPRAVLEALRQPLEDRVVSIARVEQAITYPANIMFVGSLNPCPCGYYGDPDHDCKCTPIQIAKYHKKLSGPLLDRMDLFSYVPRLAFDDLAVAQPQDTATHEHLLKAVQQANALQQARYSDTEITCNAQLPHTQIDQYCALDDASRKRLKQAMQVMQLSPRSFHRIIRVARTIADMAGSEAITLEHVSEALQYRRPMFQDAAEHAVVTQSPRTRPSRMAVPA